MSTSAPSNGDDVHDGTSVPWRPSDEVNHRHVLAPEPGDYWQEMFVPILVVRAVDGDRVFVCDKIDSDEDGRWAWRLSASQWITRAELKARLSYTFLPDQYWADVVPRAHMRAALSGSLMHGDTTGTGRGG